MIFCCCRRVERYFQVDGLLERGYLPLEYMFAQSLGIPEFAFDETSTNNWFGLRIDESFCEEIHLLDPHNSVFSCRDDGRNRQRHQDPVAGGLLRGI
jgi:hypothetical protein